MGEGKCGGIVAVFGEDSQDVLLLSGRKVLVAPVVAVVGGFCAAVAEEPAAQGGGVALEYVVEERVEAPGHLHLGNVAEVGTNSGGGVEGIDAEADGWLALLVLAYETAQALGGERAFVVEATRERRRRILKCAEGCLFCLHNA